MRSSGPVLAMLLATLCASLPASALAEPRLVVEELGACSVPVPDPVVQRHELQKSEQATNILINGDDVQVSWYTIRAPAAKPKDVRAYLSALGEATAKGGTIRIDASAPEAIEVAGTGGWMVPTWSTRSPPAARGRAIAWLEEGNFAVWSLFPAVEPSGTPSRSEAQMEALARAHAKSLACKPGAPLAEESVRPGLKAPDGWETIPEQGGAVSVLSPARDAMATVRMGLDPTFSACPALVQAALEATAIDFEARATDVRVTTQVEAPSPGDVWCAGEGRVAEFAVRTVRRRCRSLPHEVWATELRLAASPGWALDVDSLNCTSIAPTAP